MASKPRLQLNWQPRDVEEERLIAAAHTLGDTFAMKSGGFPSIQRLMIHWLMIYLNACLRGLDPYPEVLKAIDEASDHAVRRFVSIGKGP